MKINVLNGFFYFLFSAFLENIMTKADNFNNENLKVPKSEIIEFNVSGTIIATLKSNLTSKIKKLNSSSFYDLNLLQRAIIGLADLAHDKNKVDFFLILQVFIDL